MGHVVEYRLDAPEGGVRPSPRRRPPVGVRVFAGLLGVAMLLLNGALLLSDRAPGVLRRIFGEPARRLWDRIDAGASAGLPGGRVPQSDFIVHVAIWAIAAALVGLALWTWRGLAYGALGVFASSVVIELAQGTLSISRTVERNDIIANATGVVLGSTAVAACYVLWSAVAWLIVTVVDAPARAAADSAPRQPIR